MSNKASLLALVIAAAALGGCNAAESMNSMFGTGPQSPQQFATGGNQLALPPDYDLRPPHGGGERAQANATRVQGQQIITGGSRSGGVVRAAAGQSQGEAALLREAGVRPGVDDSIRREVDAETQANTEGGEKFTDKLLTWRENEEAAEEREDDRLGKPVIKKKGEIF